MKKLCFIIVIFITMLLGFKVYAQESYEINEFNVRVNVRENNTYEIIEQVTVNYNQPSTGFKRVIPLWNNEQEGFIRRFECLNATWQSTRTGEYMTVLFEEPMTEVEGERTYLYKYEIRFGKDSNLQKDNFFLNIIPHNHLGYIYSGRIELHLPKKFDYLKISVYKTENGKFSYIPVKTEHNSIYAQITEPLDPNKGIDISIDLPEGYFSQAIGYKNVSSSFTVVANFVVVCFVLLSMFACFVVQNKKSKELNEYNDEIMNISPFEAAYVIDGTVTESDIAAVIIKWANEGKISIISYAGYIDKGKINEKRIEVVKKDDLNLDAPIYEKQLFSMIFSSNYEEERMTLHDLSLLINQKSGAIIDSITGFYNSNKEKRIFTKRSVQFRDFIRFSSCIPYVYISFKILYLYTYNIGLAILLSVISSIFFMTFSYTVVNLILRKKNIRQRRVRKEDYLLATVGTGTVMFFFSLLNFVFVDFLEYLLMILAGIVIYLFSAFCRSITPYGQKVYRYILSFKEYIENKNFEHQMHNDFIKDEFYEYLPYCIVIGVLDKMFKKYDKKRIGLPSWWLDYDLEKRDIPVDFIKKSLDYSLNGMYGITKRNNIKRF